jgi:membrane-associated phospholipid phosphatase
VLSAPRWNKLLFWPLAVLDGVMLIAAVPGGNHHLTDVPGSVAAVALAIACGGRVQESLARLITGTVCNFPSAVQPGLSRITAAE